MATEALISIFPFEPYRIQNKLMNAIVKTIKNSNIGIFESPTGTGKSLSVLCAVVSWLIDEQHNNDNIEDLPENLPGWVHDFAEPTANFEQIGAINKKRKLYKITPKSEGVKVIYLSRTHSQLNQIVDEIKKLKLEKKINVVSLGSRKNLCVHEKVVKLENIDKINNKCRDLIDSSKKCPFWGKNDDFAKKLFSNRKPLNLPEIRKLGQEICACPYYGTRHAKNEAEIILAPYNSLLHETSRSNLEMSIENSVVVIDEAHNLIEALFQMYSQTVAQNDFSKFAENLNLYKNKYKNRFSRQNLQKLEKMENFLTNLGHFLENFEDFTKIFSVVEFERLSKIEDFNLNPLIQYFEENNISKKMRQFVDEEIQSNINFEKILEFAKTMATKTTESSRISIFVNAKNGDKLIKLWQLLISDEMEHVLNKSKSTILVGGTLKPFEDFVSVLMPNLKKKIEYFSCGHIVEDDKIAAFCLKNGPTNKIFDFCLANRKDEKMLKDLAFALLNFSISIPAGIVCFFQSFSYLTQIINFWKQNGLFDKLNNKKKIFIEPKNNSDVKDILNQYYNSIKFDNGGFLFCVYGGKFSEGINFKDDLARGVVCIGVPYPNRKDLELNERINYFNKIKNKSGDKFYQNICIKTINQSIGRAIRWREDFACIILIDKRYSLDENLSEGISDWIKKKKINCSKFGQCIKGVRSFFKQK